MSNPQPATKRPTMLILGCILISAIILFGIYRVEIGVGAPHPISHHAALAAATTSAPAQPSATPAKAGATPASVAPKPLTAETLAVPLIALLAAGLVAGFAAGIFGIGGGFVVVPALFVVLPLLGGDHLQYAHIAIGTSAATIIVTSIRSLMSHAKRGAVDFEVLKTWAPWIVLGAGGGVVLAGHIDGKVLTLIFASGVMLMSLNFLMPRFADKQVWKDMPTGATRAGIAGGLGVFSALLGIGGGTIAIMVMTLSGKTIHRAIATASGIGTLIAIPSTIGFALIGLHEGGLPFGSLGYINLPAAAAIACMSILTAPLGVAAAHSLSPSLLRRIFGVYLVFIAALMLKNALKF